MNININQNPNQAIKLSVTAGEILLANGAETYRVEDTMRRMLTCCGYHNSEVFAVSTGIFASVIAEAGPVTTVKRIPRRSINVDILIRMNDISRSFAEGRLSAEGALEKMEELRSGRLTHSHPFLKLFAAGIACGSFAFLFGGSLADCLNAFFTGIILQIFLFQLGKIRVPDVLRNILGGAMISFLVLIFMNIGLGREPDYAIIGSLMLLVPGLALTNAVRDVFEGDYISGSARLLDAVTTAVCLATGVGVTLSLWFHLFGGPYI